MSGQPLARVVEQLKLEEFWGAEPPARPVRLRHLCTVCRERHARFAYHGIVKADRTHTLCFQCYRSELNRQRARRALIVPPVTETQLPFEDRMRLLATRRRRAQIAARALAV